MEIPIEWETSKLTLPPWCQYLCHTITGECSSARARSVLQYTQSRSSRCQRKALGAAVSTCSALGSLTDRTSVHLFMPHLLKIWNQQGIALPGDIGLDQEGVPGKLQPCTRLHQQALLQFLHCEQLRELSSSLWQAGPPAQTERSVCFY